jgi:hypothetical protein
VTWVRGISKAVTPVLVFLLEEQALGLSLLLTNGARQRNLLPLPLVVEVDSSAACGVRSNINLMLEIKQPGDPGLFYIVLPYYLHGTIYKREIQSFRGGELNGGSSKAIRCNRLSGS